MSVLLHILQYVDLMAVVYTNDVRPPDIKHHHLLRTRARIEHGLGK